MINNIKKSLCIISKETYGEYNIHDIQTNSAWTKNPYNDYAIVPEDMIENIIETRGFCDIELNEEGTEVISFISREIPEIPEPEQEPTEIEKLQKENESLKQQISDLEDCLIEVGQIIYV